MSAIKPSALRLLLATAHQNGHSWKALAVACKCTPERLTAIQQGEEVPQGLKRDLMAKAIRTLAATPRKP